MQAPGISFARDGEQLQCPDLAQAVTVPCQPCAAEWAIVVPSSQPWLALLSPAVTQGFISLMLRCAVPSHRQGCSQSLCAWHSEIPAGCCLQGNICSYLEVLWLKKKKKCGCDCAQEAPGLLLGSQEGLSAVSI